MRARAFLLCAVLVTSAISAAAGTYKELHRFELYNGGINLPYAGVVFDHAGNLYGVAAWGYYDEVDGGIFELTPSGNGWIYQDRFLFFFEDGNPYGYAPIGGLAIDERDNVYATTSRDHTRVRGSGCGTVFSLSTKTVIHYFREWPPVVANDGCNPEANLSYYNGRLWGTTKRGGTKDQGTVFSMDTNGNSYQVDSFSGNGREPSGGINIWGYGVTYSGGATGKGNIYRYKLNNHQLNPKRELINKFNFSLNGKAGYAPKGDVLAVYVRGVRKMYGTTSAGGKGGGGAVYQLSEIAPNSNRWQLSVLHSFRSGDEKGWAPMAGLTVDAKGNLYGTTMRGGIFSDFDNSDCGTVFKLSPGKGGKWTHRILHSFDFNWQHESFEGCAPVSGVVLDKAGNLYGTTLGGGAPFGDSGGTVYKITP